MDLYSLLGVQSVAGVVRRSRLRWFGHVGNVKNGDDWESACRKVARWTGACPVRDRNKEDLV